jgi:acetyl esterase/lipase
MAGRHGRRWFLRTSVAAGAALAWSQPLFGDQRHMKNRTVTYKTVGDCAIQADLYGPADGPPRPVVVWIHGGALIMGNREGIDLALCSALLDAGFAVVSIDYRLAPETKLPEILNDVRDAFRCVREDAPKLAAIDPRRIVAAGNSAGGYLTLTTGYLINPRPKALVSFWGYGDIIGPWYSQPDPFYCTEPLVTKEEAERSVGTTAIADPSPRHQRHRFYLYCRQRGLWPREVVGLDPAKEPRAFERFCPERNVDASYPPTLLIHGTKDTDVPYELSRSMDDALARRGIAHELITVPGGGHGLGGQKPDLLAQIRERVVRFVKDAAR